MVISFVFQALKIVFDAIKNRNNFLSKTCLCFGKARYESTGINHTEIAVYEQLDISHFKLGHFCYTQMPKCNNNFQMVCLEEEIHTRSQILLCTFFYVGLER